MNEAAGNIDRESNIRRAGRCYERELPSLTSARDSYAFWIHVSASTQDLDASQSVCGERIQARAAPVAARPTYAAFVVQEDGNAVSRKKVTQEQICRTIYIPRSVSKDHREVSNPLEVAS